MKTQATKVAQTISAPEAEQKPRGFFGWLKGLFGGKKKPAVETPGERRHDGEASSERPHAALVLGLLFRSGSLGAPRRFFLRRLVELVLRHRLDRQHHDDGECDGAGHAGEGAYRPKLEADPGRDMPAQGCAGPCFSMAWRRRE